MTTRVRNNSRAMLTVSFVLLLTAGIPAHANDSDGSQSAQYAQMSSAELIHDFLSVTIPVGPYSLTTTERGDEISVEGFGCLLVPGKPILPSKIFAVAIPPAAELVEVTADMGDGVALPGTYQVPPAPLPRVIGVEDPRIYEQDRRTYQENLDSVYGAAGVYPPNVVEFVRTAGYRKYNLVDVRVTPFTYRPSTGQLIYYPDVVVHVHYRFPDQPAGPMIDDLPRTEGTAEEIILNYAQARDWYPPNTFPDGGLHDFVIITLDSLTSSVTPLVHWELHKGRTVDVVTTSWIDSNYTGYDLAEKMRNFLRDKYPSGEWGIEDVLLVGHYDDVPMRRCWQDKGYGKPETDLYYAELSLPDNKSWDADQNRRYGEDSDPIDFYSEVNVGRIPWSEPVTVLHICEKSVAYEENIDPAYKKNILLLGAFFWDNDPLPRTDNAVLMEAKVDQPWMSGWTMTRMYEKGYSTYKMDYDLMHGNVVSVWSSGTFAFVNWAGHGSPISCHRYHSGGGAFITSADCGRLNDDYPAIVFADACSNSDTDRLNIGQAMLRRGAVGFVGATKVAYGRPGWSHPNHGSSQSFDYLFTTRVTCGEHTQGAAHQWALREMYTRGLWGYVKYEMFEWGALWGNPDLSMGVPGLNIRFPEGLPQLLTLSEPADITIEIFEGNEKYIPGSGKLHYRYDGGPFQVSSWEPLGGKLYRATLPAAGCNDTPEFYFSAEGSQSGAVHQPPTAPARTFIARVGEIKTIMHDNFETNQGWTAENLGAISGHWQRGVPVNDPNWPHDPVSDSDGSGQCFLTENRYGNSDVDNGAVRLTSPTIDMSSGNISISYDYFLCLTDTSGGVDRLLVEIDSNDGAGPWTEIARHDTNGGLTWRTHAIEEADLIAAGVTLTSTMRLRFTTNDAEPESINESGLDAFFVTRVDCSEALLGDLNCDGQVDFDDIDPFVLALSGQGPYQAQYPNCRWLNADCNKDGNVDFDDIDPFVALLGPGGG